MNVLSAYNKLKAVGFVSSHVAFSLDYLNKHPGYFDDLIYTGRLPSIPALISLYVRVNAVVDLLEGDVRVSAEQTVLKFLARDIWATIVERSCSLLPASRLRPAQAKQLYASTGPYKLSPALQKRMSVRAGQALGTSSPE